MLTHSEHLTRYTTLDCWFPSRQHPKVSYRRGSPVCDQVIQWCNQCQEFIFKSRASHGKAKRSNSLKITPNKVIHLGKRFQTVDGGSQTLRQACYQEVPGSAMCVQNLNDSRGLAIRITYRISLRSSSLWEPRHPLLKVVLGIKVFEGAPDTKCLPAAFPNSVHQVSTG